MLRIAQFAQLLYTAHNIFQMVREFNSLPELRKIFVVKASLYWDSHYNFDRKVPKTLRKVLGSTAINSVLINSVTPFLFVYGHCSALQEYKDKSLVLLERIPAENNAIVN